MELESSSPEQDLSKVVYVDQLLIDSDILNSEAKSAAYEDSLLTDSLAACELPPWARDKSCR